MSDAPYVPQRFEIIGVTLIGSKLPDSTIKLDSGSRFDAWPETVVVGGVHIGLTRVEDKAPARGGGTVQYAVYNSPIDGEE